MKKTLTIIVTLMFVFASGFVTQAKAGVSGKSMIAYDPYANAELKQLPKTRTATTGSQYNKYLSYDTKISKLKNQIESLPPGSEKRNKLENRLNNLYTKMPLTNPVIPGLRGYLSNTAKLNKIESKLQSGNLTQKQVVKLNKQAVKLEGKIDKASAKVVAGEQKQYNTLETKIGKWEVKAALDSGNPNKLAKDQKKINYLKGEADWLQSTVNSRLPRQTN
ncbi:MAG: hypothetical protein ABSB18_07395 [Candidatus Omnitrophota bacterium]